MLFDLNLKKAEYLVLSRVPFQPVWSIFAAVQVDPTLSEYAWIQIGLHPRKYSGNHISIPAVLFCMLNLKFTWIKRIFTWWYLFGLSGTHLYMVANFSSRFVLCIWWGFDGKLPHLCLVGTWMWDHEFLSRLSKITMFEIWGPNSKEATLQGTKKHVLQTFSCWEVPHKKGESPHLGDVTQ